MYRFAECKQKHKQPTDLSQNLLPGLLPSLPLGTRVEGVCVVDFSMRTLQARWNTLEGANNEMIKTFRE